MTLRNRVISVLPLFLLPFACSSDPAEDYGTGGPTGGDTQTVSSTTGGDSTATTVTNTTSGTATVGTTGSGTVGTTGVGDATATTATDGTSGFTTSAGTTGAGQTMTSSSSSGGASTDGGSSTGMGGAGTTGNTGSTGGDTGGATPSPGCGKSGRPDGGKVYKNGESWLIFPDSYDGTTPLPVIFGFHGCGGSNRGDASRTEFSDLTNNNALSEYVRAIPLSSDAGGCWNYNTDITRVKALYDDLLNNYCVDVDHVFATGHSSGAQFITQTLLGSHTADAEYLNFRGVAPVASSNYGAHGTPMPVMYIQNTNDQERGGSGKDEVDRFVAANGCSSSSMPYTAAGAGCQSMGTTVDPNCIQYDDCDVPTIWCSHNDPQYSGTGHGVPCFFAPAVDEFFKSL